MKLALFRHNRKIHLPVIPTKKLIKFILNKECKRLGEINIVITSNKEILEINNKYLKHNYYTDVISFNYNKKNNISGDIYISEEQVILNAANLSNKVEEELLRVIVHGVLHLVGYNDVSEKEKLEMKLKEDEYLNVFYNRFMNE